MGRKGTRKLLKFIDDVVEIGAQAIVDQLGVEGGAARDVATGIANELCDRYARSEFYVPANLEPRLTRRDQAIWDALGADSATSRKYSQARLQEVACEFCLSPRHVRTISSLMHQRASRALQPGLPGIPEAAAE